MRIAVGVGVYQSFPSTRPAGKEVGMLQNSVLPKLNIAIPRPARPEYDLKEAARSNKWLGLWRLMTGFHGTYVGATLSLGLAAAANTATFLLLRYFIDNYLGSTERTVSLWLILSGFLALAFAQGFFTFRSRTLAARTAEGVTVRLRNYLYDHIQRLPFQFHDQNQTGELLQRATSDVDAIRRLFADQAIESGRVLLLFLINFAAILYLNWWLGVISVIIVPVITLVSAFFFKRVSDRYEKFQETEAKLSTTLQENLTGVRVVKAFARQEFEEAKFEKINWEKYARGKRLLMMHALFWPVTDLICGAQMLLGFAIGALMAINGEISVGTYLAYSGLVVWIIWPMRNLGRLIVHMSQGLVSFERVATVIKADREPTVEGSINAEISPPMRGEIVFEGVGLRYRDEGDTVLHNISFTAQPGQRVALLGASGSGKTSLVNLLPRFYAYTEGRILIDGIELTEYNRHYLRRQIGIVEQEPFLFSRTIRENITYGVEREVTQEEVEAAAKAAAIHDVILSKFPEGYNTLVGERGITLSGGQKQRMAIARTLLKDPRILILDDSTSSVDTETEAAIRSALRRLMQGRTSLIIAHRITSVMDADLILVLSQGRIIQRGTHESLMREEGLYRRIYEAQTRIEQELQAEIGQFQQN
jgi:ATP-binding cassette subfamily B protein